MYHTTNKPTLGPWGKAVEVIYMSRGRQFSLLVVTALPLYCIPHLHREGHDWSQSCEFRNPLIALLNSGARVQIVHVSKACRLSPSISRSILMYAPYLLLDVSKSGSFYHTFPATIGLINWISRHEPVVSWYGWNLSLEASKLKELRHVQFMTSLNNVKPLLGKLHCGEY
jgi:hypothetical protein